MMTGLSDVVFWETIESAWAHAEGRWQGMVRRDFREAITQGHRIVVREATHAFFASLNRECCLRFGRANVAAFCATFDDKVSALDSAELRKHVAVGPMGYMNARYFIVALGQAEYEKAMTNPASAVVCDSSPRIDEALIRLAQERGADRRRAPTTTSLPPAAVDGAAAAAEALGAAIADGSLGASLGLRAAGTTTLEDAILLFGDRIRANRR